MKEVCYKMSFLGFFKGFADGYNADVAAKKAADLEKEKYNLQLQAKANYDLYLQDKANLKTFGYIPVANGGNIPIQLIENYQEENDELRAHANVMLLNKELNKDLTPYGFKDETPLTLMQDNPEALQDLIGNVQSYFSKNDSFLADKRTKVVEGSAYYPDANETYGDALVPMLKLFNRANIVENTNKVHNKPVLKLNNGEIQNNNVRYKTVSVKKGEKNFYPNETAQNKLNIFENNTGFSPFRQNQEDVKFLREIGIPVPNDRKKIVEAAMHFHNYLNNELEFDGDDLTQAMALLKNDPYFADLTFLQMHEAVAMNLQNRPYTQRGSIYLKADREYLKYTDFIKDRKYEPKDHIQGYTKANAVKARVGRTIGLLNKTHGQPIGLIGSSELFFRGVIDAKDQAKQVLNSIYSFTKAKLNESFGSADTSKEGVTNEVYDEMIKSYDAAENLRDGYEEIIQKYMPKFGNDRGKVIKYLNDVQMGKEQLSTNVISQDDYDKVVTSNTAVIQYHSFLLAFEMAAAIQGGGDSRTISDKDVRIMQRAIMGALRSGADYQSILQEISNNMTAIAEFHGMYVNADRKESIARWKAAQAISAPEGPLSESIQGFDNEVVGMVINRLKKKYNNIDIMVGENIEGDVSSNTETVNEPKANEQQQPAQSEEYMQAFDLLKTGELYSRKFKDDTDASNFRDWANLTELTMGSVGNLGYTQTMDTVKDDIREKYNYFQGTAVGKQYPDMFFDLFSDEVTDTIKQIVQQ